MHRSNRTVATVLRLIALLLRFGLVFFLARYLPAADVGLYGVLVATVSYTVFIVGLDFYTYTSRQAIREERSQLPSLVKSHLALASVAYMIVLPLSMALFVAGLMPWHIVIWYLILVPLEHLGVELDRLLIALRNNLGASVGLFLRQGMMPLVAVPLFVAFPDMRELTSVLAFWIIFDAAGVLVGISFLRSVRRGAWQGKVDWSWIRSGLKVSLVFLVGTLSLRALFTVDRQIVAALEDLATVGAYTLFITIGSGMTSVLSAGVQQFAYPRLVQAAHDRSRVGFRQVLRGFTFQSMVAVLGISAATVLVEPLIMQFVGKPIYESYSWMLPWVMLIMSIYNLSLVPHYALYALDADRTILIVTIGALVAFALAVGMCFQYGAVVAVLAGLGTSSSLLLVCKTVAFYWRSRSATASWN